MTTGDDLPLIPEVPVELRIAASVGTLTPFIGAGASRIAGCPGWAEFADGALRHFVAQGKISHADYAQLEHMSARVKLSLVKVLEREHSLAVDFRELLHPKGRSDPDGRRLYGGLSRLARTFVTTNYDEWLDEQTTPPLPSVHETVATVPGASRIRNVYYHPEDLNAANLDTPDTVLHLHGSVRDPSGMILTTSDYIRHYANDRRANTENPVLTFLDYLFSHKVVLFVGYGLEELEILEYVTLKSQLARDVRLAPRHFMLQGFFSHERALMGKLRGYYRELGIGLIAFLKDHRNWGQLLEVIDHFAMQIPARGLAELQQFQDMRDLLND